MITTPPFKLTSKMVASAIDVAGLIEQFTASEKISRNQVLRKTNRIKTIHGSLSIEQNTLSEDQITAIHESISNADVRNMLSVSPATANRLLSALVKKGVIEKQFRNRHLVYTLNHLETVPCPPVFIREMTSSLVT